MKRWFAVGALVVSCAVCMRAQILDTRPRTEIKGSERPELIPDLTAYKMLFMNVGDGPTALKWADRAMYLEGSGLSETEVAAVLNRGTQFWTYYRGMLEKIKEIKAPYRKTPYSATERYAPEVFVQLKALGVESDKALQEAVDGLKKDLGDSGFTKFQKFVDAKVKPAITLVQ